MILFTYFLFQNQGFFEQLFTRIQEGGPLAMTSILISFLLMLFLIVRASMKLKAAHQVFRKSISLINQIALVALVIGLLSQFIGLIQVFDAFEAIGDINPSLFAGGLKITLLPPVFGGFTFLVGRLSTFILNWMRDASPDEKVSV